MEDTHSILLITLLVLGYGYFSKFLLNLNVSGPMVFTTVGILLSPLGFDIVDTHMDSNIITITAEIALIIVLFSDASMLNLKNIKWGIPARLLFIGMPITIVISTLTAYFMFPNEEILYIILMALLLAPTDAALGQAVVTDERVPENIRSSINIESGLNDGIVFPILVGVLAMITSKLEGAGLGSQFLYVGQQILFGAIVGALMGYVNALLSKRTSTDGKMDAPYQNLILIAVAILSYYTAEYVGGNGFIAAFFSGLFLGNTNTDLRPNIENFVESESKLLILISFSVFGALFIPTTIDFWNITVFIYAVLSLTVLRMLPVALSLLGTKLDFSTVLFIGWFGPRGIASVLYILIIVQEVLTIKHHETVYSVVTVTILLSVFLHGLSANPLVNIYSKKESENRQED